MPEINLPMSDNQVPVDEPAQLTGVDSADATGPEADGAFMWMGSEPPRTNRGARRVAPPPLPGASSAPIVVEDDWILIGAEAREQEPEHAADVSSFVADDPPRETTRPSSEPGRKRDSFEPVWTSAPGSASGSGAVGGLRSWARRQSIGLAVGLGCGVLMGAVAFGSGRPFERAGGAAQQPSPAAALRGWADPDVAPEMKTASDESAGAVADALDAPTDWEDDLTAELEAPAGASPFAGEPAVTLPTGETPELVAATVELLDARRFDAALIWGRALVATAPDDAVGYLCLGSALLDLGRRQEAHEVFRSCVRHATQGDVSECLTFAGRR
jgi:hypothetical protein